MSISLSRSATSTTSRRQQTRRPHATSTIRAALRTGRGRTGAALTFAVAAIAALGPAIAPSASTAFVTTPFAAPDGGHLLGGDNLGRDVLSRILDGGWQLLLVAAAATALGLVAGAAIGIAAAFRGGAVDTLFMRGVDIVLAFPQLVFALLLVSIMGPRTWLVVLAVAVAHAAQVARVIRSAALDVCERDFVKCAELFAISPWRVMAREVLPNLTSPLMVEAGLRLTYSIGLISALSFLGFGIQPPIPNWGSMVNENRAGLVANPWGVIAPVALLAILTVGVNVFTDAVAHVSLGVGGLEATTTAASTTRERKTGDE